MDLPTVRGLLTAVLMLAFVGVVIWAWSSNAQAIFEEAAAAAIGRDKAAARQNRGGTTEPSGE